MHGPGPPDWSAFDNGEFNRSMKFFGMLDKIRRAFDRLQFPPPLKKGDYMVLGIVHMMTVQNDKRVKISTLARFMNISPPAMSQRISSLTDEGYLYRAEDKSDRRVTFIELTEKGEEFTRKGILHFMGELEAVLEDIGDGRIELLYSIANELVERINVRNNYSEEGDDTSC